MNMDYETRKGTMRGEKRSGFQFCLLLIIIIITCVCVLSDIYIYILPPWALGHPTQMRCVEDALLPA